LHLSAISSGDRRRKREHIVVAGDDAETLAAETSVVELAAGATGAVVPAFIWRERDGYQVVAVRMVTLARRSNACAKLIANYRSTGHCISTSDIIGSPRPAVDCAKLIANYRSTGRCISTSDIIGSPRPTVNKFIAWAAERPSQRQSNAKNCR
jgi:hypothetical protein